MPNKKTQVAIEAIFVIGFLFMFFIMLYLVSSDKTLQFSKTKSSLEQRELCLQIASGINEVYSRGEGTVLRLDLKAHKVRFDGPNQNLEVDNNYICNIPLKEISDGSTNIFTISQGGKIQMSNIENVVVVNSNCVTNKVSFASDSGLKVVTDLVKDIDTDRATIPLSRVVQACSSGADCLSQYNLKMAYITKCKSNCQAQDICMPEEFKTNLISEYRCVEYPQGANPTNCDLFVGTSSFWDVGVDINKYALIVFENINNIADNGAHQSSVENWVKNGNTLILLGDIAQLSNNGQIDILGIRWTSLQNAPNPNRVTTTNAYYISVNNGQEPYILFGGDSGNRAYWTPARGHHMQNLNSDNLPDPSTPKAFNFISEAVYSDNTIGLGKWEYGTTSSFGQVYFFSSCVPNNDPYIYLSNQLTPCPDTNPNDEYCNTFQLRLRESIQRIFGTYFLGYLETIIPITKILNAPVTDIVISTKHYIDTLPQGAVVEEFVDEYLTSNSSYKKICDLKTSTTEILDPADLDPIDRTGLNPACDEINTMKVLDNEIKLRTIAKVTRPQLNKNSYYNYQDLKVCYDIQ
ncbi:hypothetical protein HYX18_02610 [Candidatus Woesearchaeota archaeon]|nr:hypothetical protein [Candidatus Woesearchaeota archaeon]